MGPYIRPRGMVAQVSSADVMGGSGEPAMADGRHVICVHVDIFDSTLGVVT
eukprot:SAG11_NODE_767_length_7273_cov_3.106914_5_plen_51_part_00